MIRIRSLSTGPAVAPAVLGLALILLAPPLAAQTPEATARAIAERLHDGDFAGLSSHMHPDALAELRGFLQPLMGLPDAAAFRQAMFQVDSGDAFAALSDAEVFARFMEFALSQDPGTMATLATAEVEVVGHLMEGDTAHVVSRTRYDVNGIPMSVMEVSSFMEKDGRWYSLLSGDLSGMAAAMARMVGGGPAPDGDPRD